MAGRKGPPERTGRPSVVAGRRPVLELLASGRTVERILIARGVQGRPIGQIRRSAGDAGIPVRQVPRSELDRTAPGINHQGVAALVGDYRYATLESLVTLADPCLLFLDGITDPHNLGSLIRSVDGAGFHGVVIPTRRSATVTDAVGRVSAGATEVVPVARVPSLGAALDRARSAGLWIAGLDADADADIWTARSLDPPVGLVLGSEDRGISKGIRARCDALVSIPLSGTLASLNVGVAGGVAMFEVARRRARSATLSSGAG